MQKAENWTLSNESVVEIKMSVSERAFMLPYLSTRFNRRRQCFILHDDRYCEPSIYRNTVISPLLTCPQIQIKDNDFGSKLVDIQTDYTFSGLPIYQSKDANIGYRICAKDLSKIKLTSLKDDDRFLSTLTLICICVSLVALLLTFFTYCLFPSIRTLPGINNMILVLFLFLAQMCLIFRPLSYTSGLEIVSALSHFSWLLVFFWLQICSFHMFRVFTAKQRWDNSPTSIKKTVTKYFLYAFGSASIIVTLNIIISLILSNGKYTGYDKALTLMTHKTAFIITLLVPLIFVCLTNIFFYILTAYKICSSPDIESKTGNKVQFSVYIKLFTLTGLSWMLQIIDAFIDVSVFSYFVAILNGLQGLLIFLSCVCNERVWNLYKIAWCKNINFRKHPSTLGSQTHRSSN
ncbi:probable G-protein coupled receptor Mth-like 4 [Saccostrea echinata]|uniref:probable G-protein coupled receptor Mth-like 4 n=1 Tax=Saccostrea echinata TaxID=191078 RepID=UPI002A82FD24|nr:probable G-protein coupled receptor Mth-like 4 [Saccostrea echinata]